MVQIAGVTITSPEGTVISDAEQVMPGCEEEMDGDLYEFPFAFFAYKVEGISAGDTIQVEYIFPEGSGPFSKFFMFGPTPDNPEPHCYEFTFDGTTGAQFTPDGNLVLTFVDGGRGDSDLAADGTVTDPGGPALLVVSSTETESDSGGGNGGCTVAGTSGNSSSMINLLIPLVLGLFAGARLIRYSRSRKE